METWPFRGGPGCLTAEQALLFAEAIAEREPARDERALADQPRVPLAMLKKITQAQAEKKAVEDG